MQFVFARFIREIGNRLAIGGPDRRALLRGDGLRQVTHIALVGRHGDNFATELKGHARTGWGQRRIADVFRALHKTWPRHGEIGADADRELVGNAGFRVEHMQITGLLIDNLAAARRRIQHRKIGVARQLANFLAAGIEGINIEFAIAIGAEINRVTHPDRVHIVGATGRLRNLFGAAIGKIE